MLDAARQRVAEAGAPEPQLLRATLPDAELPDAYFDLVWARWMLSFPPDSEAIVARLATALAPGGLLVVQDYNHDGVGLWPESRAFRAAIEAAHARCNSLLRSALEQLDDFGDDAESLRWLARYVVERGN